MLLPEARIELLHQHDTIRALVARVREEVARVQAGGVSLAELRACLRALDSALSDHNQREERLFCADLRGRVHGGWRIACMSIRHQQEHDHLQHALARASLTGNTPAGLGIVRRLLDRVLDHIHGEEQELYRGLAESESAA